MWECDYKVIYSYNAQYSFLMKLSQLCNSWTLLSVFQNSVFHDVDSAKRTVPPKISYLGII